jgi:hypothetical protein
MASSKDFEDIITVELLFTDIDDSLSTIFPGLTNICHRLITNCDYTTDTLAFHIFDIILQNYIKLLDIDEFVDAITHDKSIEHNRFLRQYYSITNQYDIRATKKTSRDIFFFLFDQINSSKRIISYLQNNLSNENQILLHTCSFILYTILKLLDNLRVKLTSNDLVKYQNNLFNSFIVFIDQYFIRKETSKQHNILIGQIGRFIWNISHITPIIPILINANCPQACLRWLALSYLDSDEYEFILHILYNIARHDEGGSLLNKLDCAKIVRQFKTKVLNMKTDFIIHNERYLTLCRILDLILSLVVDLDELYLEEVNNGTIRQVLSLSKMIFEHPYYIPRSELLIILMKLCTNDHIMDYIIHHEQCPKFFIIISNTLSLDIEKNFYKFIENENDFPILSITALANIFWSISFDDRYKNPLIQNINLIKKLEEFREIYPMNNVALYIHIPYQMSSLRRAIDGIFYNLYPSKFEIKSNPTSKKICSLMISYSQVNINFCQELCGMLNKLPELSINVDYKNGKYSWKEIIETIEQSHAVLFLISKEFYYSKSCRQEFIYVTDTFKKLFFPIFIERDFKPSGWLHKRVARLKSIRFGENDFLNTCEELLALINDNLSLNISLINNTLDITKWNDNEIKQWFSDHHIISELYEFYHFQNGNELLLYATATLAFSWIKEYERIKVRFEEKFKQQERSLSQDQFLQFIYALKRLPKQT